MTVDELRELAKEGAEVHSPGTPEHAICIGLLAAFNEIVRLRAEVGRLSTAIAAEREACAPVAWRYWSKSSNRWYYMNGPDMPANIADAMFPVYAAPLPDPSQFCDREVITETVEQMQERMRGWRAEFERRHPSAAGKWDMVTHAYQDSLHTMAYLGWCSLLSAGKKYRLRQAGESAAAVATGSGVWITNPENVLPDPRQPQHPGNRPGSPGPGDQRPGEHPGD